MHCFTRLAPPYELAVRGASATALARSSFSGDRVTEASSQIPHVPSALR